MHTWEFPESFKCMMFVSGLISMRRILDGSNQPLRSAILSRCWIYIRPNRIFDQSLYYLMKSAVFQAEVNVRKSIFVEFVIFSFFSIHILCFLFCSYICSIIRVQFRWNLESWRRQISTMPWNLPMCLMMKMLSSRF